MERCSGVAVILDPPQLDDGIICTVYKFIYDFGRNSLLSFHSSGSLI